MVNPNNIVPQGVPNPSRPLVDASDAVRRKPLNVRKEFKNVLEGRENIDSEDVEIVDDNAGKNTRSKSIFELSAKKGFRDNSQDSQEGLLSGDSKENLFSSDSTLNQQPVVDLKTLAKFMEKPEFAQEVADLSSIPSSNLKDDVKPIKVEQPITIKVEQPITSEETPHQSLKGASLSKTSTKKETHAVSINSTNAPTNLASLTGVLPPPNPMINEVASLNQPVSTMVSPSMQDLIDKLVSAVHTMQSTGKTETVLTLKELDGAQVTITTYDTAKKEVNITFSKLTQETESLMQQNRQSLESNLRDAGVVYHMIVFTTVDTVNIPTDTHEKSFTRDKDAEGGEQQQKKKK